jgi:hypothetical protein
MKVYKICNWARDYEVNQKGNVPTGGYLDLAMRRKGPLKYVRWPVMGTASSAELDDLIKTSWRSGTLFHWAVLGIYLKLLDIAADHERDKRGWLIDKNNVPVGPGYFARRFNEPDPRLVIDAFDILTMCGWIELRDVPDFICTDAAGISGDSGKVEKPKKRSAAVQHQLDLLFNAEEKDNRQVGKPELQREPAAKT